MLCLFVGAVAPGAGSPEQLKALVKREWPTYTTAVLDKAAAVSGCESGWADKVGDGGLVDAKWGPSLGRFQIRTLWAHLAYWGRWAKEGNRQVPNRNPILMLVPAFNAQAAYDISGGGTNWKAWTCG